MAATLGGSRPNADPFSEHVQVMKALYQEYTKRDDIQAVELVDSMLHEMNTLCRQREEAVKDIIKSLSAEVRTLEPSSVYPNPEGSHERRVAGLQADVRDMKQAVDQLHAAHKGVEQQGKEVVRKAADIAAWGKAQAESHAADEKQLWHRVSLFAHISHISWDKDRSRVKGTVSDPTRGNLREFDIDPSGISHFEAVNKLWQLL